MDVKEKIIEKFNKLLNEGNGILEASGWDGRRLYGETPSNIDYQRWRTEALNLIKRVCGEDSEHYKQLLQIAQDDKTKNESYYFAHCYGIVQAAKRDFDDDFLIDVRYLVRADLLDDFLSQAEILSQEGYHVSAASLAGAVLEDTLRKLCDKKNISYPDNTKIDTLNIALAKANVYDKLVQKEITAKADLRNNADHGNFGKIKPDDVADMIKWIGRFIRDYMK